MPHPENTLFESLIEPLPFLGGSLLDLVGLGSSGPDAGGGAPQDGLAPPAESGFTEIGPGLESLTLPSGRTYIRRYDPALNAWVDLGIDDPPGGSSGAAASRYAADLQFQLGQGALEIDRQQLGINQFLADTGRQGLFEQTRSNKEFEAEARRGRALTSATNAVSAYLRGTELSDARRLAAFQKGQELLPFLVSPGQEFQAGFGPQGPLAQFSQQFGLPFDPLTLPTRELEPQQLAQAPTGGQIGQGVLELIGGLQRAGLPEGAPSSPAPTLGI